MELEGKAVGILVEATFEDLELYYPLLRLREAGAKVSIIGPEKGTTYNGKRGHAIAADLSPEEVDPESLDALIVPGGYAPDRMRRHPGLLELVRGVDARGGIIGMICHAGWVGISAGIVRGKRVTSLAAIRDDMVNAGGDWVDEEVVVDGNLITSRTPSDLPAFCRAIIEQMS
jgi:protease I